MKGLRIYMRKHSEGRLAGIGRRAAIVVAALLVPFAFAASASAEEHHPTGVFAVFKQCPLVVAGLTACTYAETTSGEFTVGSRKVPINKPIVLQGGYIEEESGELAFHGAENGETLTKVPLYVPGGLLNIVAPEWLNKEQKEKFEKTINEGATGVTATNELAKPASAIKLNILNLAFETGVALQLPLKVKLGNVFLGSGCYVGSEASPVTLNLTTGETSPLPPNKAIHGSAGLLELAEEGAYLRLYGGSLVDNTWAAPAAHGCGSTTNKTIEKVVDEAVNHALGLPSAAGHNTAILNGELQSGLAGAVKASE
jgi:hypothetical protein